MAILSNQRPASSIAVTDGPYTYWFNVAPGDAGAPQMEFISRPWQPGDPQERFYIRVHPWDGGLFPDRIENGRTYARANADASWENLLYFPPKLTVISLPLRTDPPRKFVEFNGKVYIVGGRYLYAYDPANDTVTLDRDFGAGSSAVDAAAFQNELIVAMGESERIWRRTTSGTWTQASDNVYAIALGVIGSRLYRAAGTNKLTSCPSSPLVLAAWTPASPNEVTVGDTNWPIVSITDYGGIAWVGKADGVYAPDGSGRYFNQVPQLARSVDSLNTLGAFTAQGSLFVPSIASLFRVRLGQARAVGPELTQRPGMRFRTWGGFEYSGALYVVCTDEAGESSPFICKMIADTRSRAPGGNEYIYHEWVRLPGTSRCVTIVSVPNDVTKFIAGAGNDIAVGNLGRGGGRFVDDPAYEFGTDMEIESGCIPPSQSAAVTATLVGVSVVADFRAPGERLKIAATMECNSPYEDLLSTQEGGGTPWIEQTDGWQTVTRYARPGMEGQFLHVQLVGKLVSANGGASPRVREVWAHGYLRPRTTDIVRLVLVADARSRGLTGVPSNLTAAQVIDIWKHWMELGSPVEIRIEGYNAGKPFMAVVTDVSHKSALRTVVDMGRPKDLAIVQVTAVRVDYTNRDRSVM